MHRAEKKSLQILLSRTQAGPGRTVKQEQEEVSRNHVQAFQPILVSYVHRKKGFISTITVGFLYWRAGQGLPSTCSASRPMSFCKE